MGRTPKIIFLNALVPGAGLVVLRREWLGLATSVLFAMFALIFIVSRWITPSDIPTWASYMALAGLILVWAGSLAVVVNRAKSIGDPDFIAEIEHLRQEGADAIAANDLEEAHRALLVALNLDDEDAETWLLWSKLMERQGNARAAQVGWKRLSLLSHVDEHRQLAKQKLGGSS